MAGKTSILIEIDIDLLEENCLWQRKTSILIEIAVDLLEENCLLAEKNFYIY